MLGLLLDNQLQSALDADLLWDSLVDSGVATTDEEPWWYDLANTINLIAGSEPSVAYLLLPYAIVKKLSKNQAGDTVDDEDTDGLNSEGEVVTPGRNIYDRILQLDNVWIEDPEFGDPGHDKQFIRQHQQYKGWFFASATAIDPNLDPRNDNTAYLCRFVDLRGVEDKVPGPLGTNINIVTEKGPLYIDGPVTFPYSYIFQDGTATWQVATPTKWDSWQKVADWLWDKVADHFPNEKYEDTPLGWSFPEIPNGIVNGYDFAGNDRPHNLDYKSLSVWGSFARFVNHIHHEVFPTFDGTFTVSPIHAHCNEDVVEAIVPQRALKLRLGAVLSRRIPFIIDHDIPESSPLVPHSFVGVYTKIPNKDFVLPFTPIYLWRGEGSTLPAHDDDVVVTENSLFIHALLKDEDYFPPDYLEVHPFIPAGDPIDESDFGSTGAVIERSRSQYLDLTFLCLPSDHPEFWTGALTEIETLNIDEAIDAKGMFTHPLGDIAGLDFERMVYPSMPLGQLIAKWHLKAQLHGDLGMVKLHGFHNLLPTSLHQSVTLDAKSVTTTLEGGYTYGKQYTRDVATRNILGNTLFTGLAVVVPDVLPADPPTGASGDFSTFQQTASEGVAVRLRMEEDGTLKPDFPAGGSVTDALINFFHERDDAEVVEGALVFITKEIGHLISAIDYLKGAPNYGNSKVLTTDGSGVVVWGEFQDVGDIPDWVFDYPDEPPAGISYSEGYCIEIDGNTIHVNMITNAANAGTPAVGIDVNEWQLWFHNPGAAARTDAQWKTVDNFLPGEDQMWWHRDSGLFEFKSVTDYGGAADTPQALINWGLGNGGDWQWRDIENFDATEATQFVVSMTGTWQFKDVTNYLPLQIQVPINNAGNWRWFTLGCGLEITGSDLFKVKLKPDGGIQCDDLGLYSTAADVKVKTSAADLLNGYLMDKLYDHDTYDESLHQLVFAEEVIDAFPGNAVRLFTVRGGSEVRTVIIHAPSGGTNAIDGATQEGGGPTIRPTSVECEFLEDDGTGDYEPSGDYIEALYFDGEAIPKPPAGKTLTGEVVRLQDGTYKLIVVYCTNWNIS